MQVIVRDDDISYFTCPEELNRLYAPLWDEGKPVCLAVVPFASQYLPGWKGDMAGSSPSIMENQGLRAFLNERIERGLVEIAMHGHSHLPGEYDAAEKAQIARLFAEGLEILRLAFPTAQIRTFIPPHERFSATARDFLIAQGFNICTTSVNLARPGRLGWWAFRLKRWLMRPGFQPISRCGESKLFACDEYLFKPGEDPQKCLHRAEKMAVFCSTRGFPLICANHHWHFSDSRSVSLLTAWHSFLKGLIELEDVTFTTFSSYEVSGTCEVPGT